ncbi:MAG: hypothetical protein ACRD3C_26490 [Vicinamibacterales bacterium]
MRTTFLFAVALVLSVSGPAAAQEWDQYTSLQDGFKINFPGQPRITDTTWISQLNYKLPARVYSAERGRERYTVTVVDYSGLEQQGIERSKTCPPGNANCRATAGAALGPGYWRHDERGALVYATFKLLQRNAKLTDLAWEWQDMVEGHNVQLTNADGSRTFAYVSMHQHKLYILEGTVPDGYPEPGLFQQSMGYVDKDGNGIRYQTIYSNSYHAMGIYPVPTYGNQGRGAGAGNAAPGGRGAGAGEGAGAGAGNPGR